MSSDLSSLGLAMMNEEDLRIQVAATISSRSDQAAMDDQAHVRQAWNDLQAQERAVESLEEALQETKRAQAERLAVVGSRSVTVANKPSSGDQQQQSSSEAQAEAPTMAQLQFQLARAKRELKRAGTALDEAQHRADERQAARFEVARQKELAESNAFQLPASQQPQPWSPATPVQAAFASDQRAGSFDTIRGMPARSPQPLALSQRQSPSLSLNALERGGGGVPAGVRRGPIPLPVGPPGQRGVVPVSFADRQAPLRPSRSHLRGLTREAYSGGDVLPSLSRVHVSRADIRAKHLRYEDDSDEKAYRARIFRRRRLELIAALQEYVQGILDNDNNAHVPKKEPHESDNQGKFELAKHSSTSKETRVKVESGSVQTPQPAKGSAAQVVKREVSSLSLSPHRRSASGYDVIDVDDLMEAEEADSDAGQPLLQELLSLLDTTTASVDDEKTEKEKEETRKGGVKIEDDSLSRQTKGAKKGQRSAAANVSGRGARKRARQDDNEDENEDQEAEREAALWNRAEALVAAHPGLPINQTVQVIPGLHMPSAIYENLLDYQQEGVRWLLHLHGQRSGGILGDEMGLGKTIQVAALLNALHTSGQLRGPVLIIAPMTVLRQWMAELHRWAPYIRSCVMHESAAAGHGHSSRDALINSVRGTPAVIVATYAALRTHCDLLHSAGFQYLIVDEGHKLSNPEAAVTLAAKSFPTPHRLVLSGSPIQNSLKELWCLFDFIRPGLLGSLNKFVDEFEAPISQSKNVRASPLALATAMECAKLLQAHIAPYLLRRLKRHVNASLPPKIERVIRVPLTDEQLEQYVDIVSSPGVQRLFSQTLYYPQIAGGPLNRDNRDSAGCLHVAGRRFNLKDARKRNTSGVRLESFRIMNQLRQVCNHADIYAVQKGEANGDGDEMSVVRHRTGRTSSAAARTAVSHNYRSNNPVNLGGSAKLGALQQMLREWRRFGHRVLVFSQTRMMLDIIENLCEQESHRYIRMDGTTNSHHRQELIDRFNADESIFVALLTTRVGGIGVNLTGADRVVIFDPDWNPVTDIQARERAWRIGQTREVCVYRLISSGTVEEAILRRQLAKTYVTDKVLRDPTLQRFFHVQDSFVENFLLGAEYESRVPMGKKHVLGGVGAETPFVPGHLRAAPVPRAGAITATPQARISANPSRLPPRSPGLFADDAGGEQEVELTRDDVNDAVSPTTALLRRAQQQGQQQPPWRTPDEVEKDFGVIVHVTNDDNDDAHESGGVRGSGNEASHASLDNSETSLLKKLMDGNDVSVEGKDSVSRSLARAKARSMLQRVAEDGRARDVESQRREFSLLWAAQKHKEKDLADRAEQRRYFEEEMARKRRQDR